MNGHTSILARLAAYAASVRAKDVPSAISDEAVRCIADTVGCMAAGSRTAEARMVLAAEPGATGRFTSAVIGSSRRLQPMAAAKVNGYMGDIHELNDLTCGHTSIGVVPAALALAEALGSSGAELLRSIVVGVETASRFYSLFYPTMKAYDDVGMVCVGPVNSLGAAAAAADLLGLNERGILNAMAIALAQAGWCPAEVIFGDGRSAKPLLFGAIPAQTGITAALSAKAGVEGPPVLLESGLGYLRTVAHSYDLAILEQDNFWFLANPRRKLHACCGYIHSALDSVVNIRNHLSLPEVARITVAVPEYIVSAISKARPPQTANEARFHMGYCLAVAMTGADAILPTHSDRFETFNADPAFVRLMNNVQVCADPALTHYHESVVSVFSADGRELASQPNRAPKGSPQNAMLPDQLWAKFRQLATCFKERVDLGVYESKLLNLATHAKTDWIVGDLANSMEHSPFILDSMV
jgi:2-methylcitrate dehydratase PrpD